MDDKGRFGVVVMSTIWSIKHRPQTVDDVVGQPHITDEMPYNNCRMLTHMIFYSVGAGTGKTRMAHALANDNDCTLHVFNACSKKTRGIEFIEEQLIPLASNGQKNQIFLLDEADQLTPAAQSALKGVMENTHGVFILTCNDLSKLTPWIQSRCNTFVFKPIDVEDVIQVLMTIASIERVSIKPTQLRSIAEAHEGDLRSSINCLQAFANAEDGDRFLLRITDKGGFREQQFLTACFRDRDFEMAKQVFTSSTALPRDTIKNILTFAVESDVATTDNKMKVIETTINAERDFAMGVWDYAIVDNYIRELC